MTDTSSEIIGRAQFNAQAIATMGQCPEWDRAITSYVAWDVRARADEKFGELQIASNERYRDAFDMENRFGPNWREHPEGQPVWEDMCAQGNIVDTTRLEKFYSPYWEAMRQLAVIPAPTLAAAAWKAAMIELQDLWNDSGFEGDCIAIIDADLARFTGAGQ